MAGNVGKWRLIALDMDGTTLMPDGSISNENRTWIRRAREAGAEVTFATGRPFEGVVETFVGELGLTMPVVTINGGEIRTADGQLLVRHAFRTEDFMELYNMAREHGLACWGRTTSDSCWLDSFPDNPQSQTWLKFGMSGTASALQTVREMLRRDTRFEVTNSNPLNIEVNPYGVNKAAGLQLLCDRMGLQARQVIAMGDSENDISMLKWAGLGIAMGNAQDAVKQAADAVTSSVEEHGVAAAIERHVFR